MSIEAIGYAFTLILPASEKWLLICLANHAPVAGELIFPSLDTLELNSGMSRSTIKRAFKDLMARGIVERVAESTGVSPAFYRIAGVPEPREFERQPTCPPVLRKAVILAFEMTCEYCRRSSESRESDPDGKPWNVDRVVPGKRSGIYSPDNVTLACRACNAKKKAGPAPAGTRTLTELQRNKGVQFEPSPTQPVGAHGEPPEGTLVDPRGVHADPLRGFMVNPEPCTESFIDPSLILKAAAAPRLSAPPQNPDDNVAVITKLAHETYDLLGIAADSVDLTEALKSRCATLGVAYRSDVVLKALDSARWQRTHKAARA